MSSTIYERHVHRDPDFPIIFHCDSLSSMHNDFIVHWHENLELLYFWKGSGMVTCDTAPVNAVAGDVVIINSCALHSVSSLTPSCSYYCLIVDKAFCEEFDLPVGEINLHNVVNDAAIRMHFDRIAQEMTAMAPYYKPTVKSEVLSLLARLFRTAGEEKVPLTSSRNNARLDMVREAITYIRKRYKEDLSVDDICAHVGFSKYYFCRVFREITSKTVVEYINFLRCEHARKLLAAGRCNVSESAERSGFHNLSYFSKTYKRHMGVLPSVSVR